MEQGAEMLAIANDPSVSLHFPRIHVAHLVNALESHDERECLTVS